MTDLLPAACVFRVLRVVARFAAAAFHPCAQGPHCCWSLLLRALLLLLLPVTVRCLRTAALVRVARSLEGAQPPLAALAAPCLRLFAVTAHVVFGGLAVWQAENANAANMALKVILRCEKDLERPIVRCVSCCLFCL